MASTLLVSMDGTVATGPEPTKAKLAIEEDIMQLARLGQIAAIQSLFEAEKFDANYKDEQGITPLHWAAIKNHYALCHFLIQAGADVNASGGDLNATPILWAARSCNYYIVNLLLHRGADPLRTDSQGFNLLQNATLDGNVYQVLLLLYQDIPPDTPDSQGHTSLMWAAYKGFPSCVEALMRFGASVAATDDEGFTALHWALVKGSQDCIQKLVEYGADRFAETTNGKTPAVVATEMNSQRQWHRALSNCGYDEDGNLKHFPLPSIVGEREVFLSRLFFFWPFLLIFCGIYIISGMPIFAGFPIALFSVGILQSIAGSQRLLQWMPAHKRSLAHTTYLSGVFAGTLFWTGARWFTVILPQTFATNTFLNILFAALYSLCGYFYFQSMLEDPGWVPKVNSRTEQKTLVQDLVDKEIFNERTFCTTCLLRKPLRSKHCRRCGRCVAKHDHHCPWINNCVAVNNHRHFLLYVLNLELGIIVFVWLSLKYLDSLPAPPVASCNILGDELCAVYNKDSFTIVVALWAMVQLTWVTMLMLVQLIQVSRAQTTLETMRGRGHMSSVGETLTSAVVAGTASLDDAGLTQRSLAPDPVAVRQPAPRNESCLDSWKRLLGVDTFMATAIHGAGSSQARRTRNAFSKGLYTNCADFFCDPSPLFGRRENGIAFLGGKPVDYTRLYDLSSPLVGGGHNSDREEARHLIGDTESSD